MKKKRSIQSETPGESSASTDVNQTKHNDPIPVASFPIVGVGASAGGLEAFTQLLKAMPTDTGMAFVLVQHLDPDHESALTQILSRVTSLPVCDITNNQLVESNHVYIIPPDTNLNIANGRLKLQPRLKTRTPHRPIDLFFESLALDQHERAIGVVLSGTASDGTLGLEAIKVEGGITFAQDDSAKYESMPRSAVAAGCVDLVLSPNSIALELARIAKHPYLAGQPFKLSSLAHGDLAEVTKNHVSHAPITSDGNALQGTFAESANVDQIREMEHAIKDNVGYTKTLSLLSQHSGVDFSLYKSSTIQRRINRRLVINRQDTLQDYSKFLQGNAKELDALCTDVLINVTSFFRNPEAFDALQREILPALLEQPGNDPIRVWVPGCSSGQEAYSIAISFLEAAETSPRGRNIQIFATDLNEKVLDKARHGLYPKSISDQMSPERLRRFFVEEQGGYRVSALLREMVVFARQNLFADPPFSRMDLISCRNLLIYIGLFLQKKAIPTLHFALKPKGYLFLGASESISGFAELFDTVDKKSKIYSKKAVATPAFHVPANRDGGTRISIGRPTFVLPAGPPLDNYNSELSAQREADRITVNQFAPPAVLVDANLQVLQFRGSTSAFLEPPVGKASFNLLKMAREGLMLHLRAAINEAKKENKTVRRDNVRIQENGETREVNLEIIPLKNLLEPCYLIFFEDAVKRDNLVTREKPVKRPISKKEETSRINELEAELSETREYLQSVQERHEAANEELQVSSEEIQSANEELQSINEELETSKEELESANEELTTVNDEMAYRNLELSGLNNDLVNFQNSTRLVVLLLGRDLTIRRFTPQAEKQFELLATDVGRPISHIRHNLVLADGTKTPLDLEGICVEVIATVIEQEREVLDKAGRWHSLRVRPYTTLDQKVDGAVTLLLDIDELKHSELAVASARDYAQSIVATVREPMLVLDKELRVESANHSFYNAFNVTPDVTIGKFIYELGDQQWDIPRLRELLENILTQSTSIEEFQVEHDFKQLGRRTMLLNARRILDPQRKIQRILLAIEDITERNQLKLKLQASETLYRRLFETAKDGVLILDADDGRILEANPFMTELSGLPADEFIGKELWDIGLFRDKASNEAVFRELLTNGHVRYDHLPLKSNRQEPVEVEFVSNVYEWDHRRVAQCNIRDISDRSRLEKQTQNQASELSELHRRKDEFLAMLSHELRSPLAPIASAVELLGLQQGSENPIQMQARTIIGRQMKQLQRLVDDLLDVSRITTGRVQLRRERVLVSRIVEETAETVRPLLEQRRHEFTLSMPSEPIWLNADVTRLQQVLTNLLTNAAKYTGEGGHIWLTVQREKEECVLRIRDSGVGISKELLPHIFDLFTQAERSLDRSQGGLGIGLALVQRLTNLHGGTVTVESELGKGSEFIVRLPVASSDDPQVTLPGTEIDPPVATPLRVLVVDDNVDAVLGFSMLLVALGHEVQTAHDGLTAVQAAINYRPDVILLDIGLPVLNGYEVAKRIRQEPTLKNVVLAALTGYGQEADRQTALQAGFNHHLVKPARLEQLQKILSTVARHLP